MNMKIGIDRIAIEQLYKKNKDYILPIFIIMICFFLLVEITIPQIGILSVRQQDVAAEKAKLEILNNNLNILSSLNDNILDFQLGMASSAFPPDKNFTGILDAVNIAANKAGIILGDYDFQVGDLSKVTQGRSFPSLDLSLSIVGGSAEAARFVSELYKSFPISEISDIEVSKNSSKVTVSFYYKPFVKVADNYLPIHALPKNYSDTLKDLTTWNNPTEAVNIIPSGSRSATITAPF